MNTPIAVATVTFHPGRHFRTMLQSLDAATTGETVAVIADNGGQAAQLAAQLQDAVEQGLAVVLDSGGNIGYGAAMNRALAQVVALAKQGSVRGDYCVLTNPDVTFDPGSIDALLDCARQWPDAAAIGPAIRDVDGSRYPSARTIPTLRNGIGHALFGSVWPNNPCTRAYQGRDVLSAVEPVTCGWLSGSCLLVNLEAFTRIGGFDERYFMYLEDVDLGDRFQRAGYVNVFCPAATVAHDRGHVAKKYPAAMLPAHHRSAYRFQADRHSGLVYAPLRAALAAGLALRCGIAILVTKLRRGQHH
ncbi:glycosyltransferase [Corynebacterium choanae]|uniref:glycosyltransferase n=1 Tax=Corynebacterium choanae TaxID=1862358 RepID=UPI000F4FD5FA|nr:glycosyltransferase family 2 protein [Corynebacterium choanae]